MNLFKPTQRQIDNWKIIVENGKKNFIKKHFISFGLNMIIFVFAIEYINTKPIEFSNIFSQEVIIRAVLGGLIGGGVFSYGSWIIGNYRFGKYINKN